ncbi:Uncharacterised protein [BD1-7 clade bacterium]|uniref:UPF0056 membrane protein n=1 Tax=BD1-7 clade bacterium TaxID=2029982 RepID=A0A5S9P072_9GAMM|nr:Uncharacterised protein [BD1-7 clade bacterium]CAA0096496.1 Uncharacterised protein [BD1-7 clade bacterium]CAA0109046.1 Uncharacterised protein [BD1-7 clade bacterium]CAA0115817.1 Uncharacterised protein [BD1-7 clade bacterium]CAA0119497.1 Uncharacterised protein [BD1-7 clade bacterium]
MLLDNLVSQFIVLWAVIDPVGTIPVFLAVASGSRESELRKLAFAGILIAGGVLMFFILVGQVLLDSMGIPLSAFQIAGGIVLFVFAMTMIFGQSKPEQEIHMITKGMHSAVFPLAIPSIASPGAMVTVVLLTDNNRFSFVDQSVTTVIMLAVLGITLLLLLAASVIYRFIGETGASIVSRVMGLILAAVATNSILLGLGTYFGIKTIMS